MWRHDLDNSKMAIWMTQSWTRKNSKIIILKIFIAATAGTRMSRLHGTCLQLTMFVPRSGWHLSCGTIVVMTLMTRSEHSNCWSLWSMNKHGNCLWTTLGDSNAQNRFTNSVRVSQTHSSNWRQNASTLGTMHYAWYMMHYADDAWFDAWSMQAPASQSATLSWIIKGSRGGLEASGGGFWNILCLFVNFWKLPWMFLGSNWPPKQSQGGLSWLWA